MALKVAIQFLSLFLFLCLLSNISGFHVQAADTPSLNSFSIGTTYINKDANLDAIHIDSINSPASQGSVYESARIPNPISFAMSPVVIGSMKAPQNMSLLLDTGSPDMWIYTTTVDPATISGGGHLFNPSYSSTFNKTASSFSIKYVNQAYNQHGPMGRDIVQIGHSQVNQSFGLVPYDKPSIAGNQLVGVIGLGRATGSANPPQAKWFDNIKAHLNASLFTYSANYYTGIGSWDFGVLDPRRYIGGISYVPLSDTYICRRFWGFDGLQVIIKGKAYKHSDCVIIDSGSIYNILDADIVKAYWDQVPGSHLNGSTWLYPCKVPLPDLHFDLAGQGSAVIPGRIMRLGLSHDPNLCEGSLFNGTGSGTLGQMFMQAELVIFDEGNHRLGFAALP